MMVSSAEGRGKMLERLQNSVDPRPTANFALTAMDTAIRQQREFEKTAEEIRVRQEQEEVARQRKARQAEEARSHTSEQKKHAVDVVVGSSSSGGAGADSQPDQRGIAVDVKI